MSVSRIKEQFNRFKNEHISIKKEKRYETRSERRSVDRIKQIIDQDFSLIIADRPLTGREIANV